MLGPLRMSREPARVGWGWSRLVVCPSALLFLNTEPAPTTSRSWDQGPSVRRGPGSETHGARQSNQQLSQRLWQRPKGWEPMAWFRDHSQGGKPQHVQGGISPSLVVHTCPGSGRHSLGEVRGQGQHRRYKSRLGGVGVGLTVGWGSACAQARAGRQGWREGSRLYRLAFLEGALRLEPFPSASL